MCRVTRVATAVVLVTVPKVIDLKLLEEEEEKKLVSACSRCSITYLVFNWGNRDYISAITGPID